MKLNRNEMQTVLQRLTRILVCLLTLAGCATNGTLQTMQRDGAPAGAKERHVQPRDSVSVHYQCRLRSGEVVAATDSVEGSQRKSNLYIPRQEAGPLEIEAANAADAVQVQETPYVQRSFEEEISHQLAFAIVGMKEGDAHTAEVRAENAPAQEATKYIAHLTRVRTRPKEMKMPRSDYEYRVHQKPEVGQAYSYDPDFPGRVESVSDQEVTISFSAEPGTVVSTPFGPGRVREEGENYKIDIDARKGALVRADAMVGHIADVDDRTITVDFGNPFGGETLLCDVTVEKITDAKPIQSSENSYK